MKIYKTQKEVEKDIKDNVLLIKDDVKFECSISIEASIKIIGNINAEDINAWNINAWNINAWNINAEDINAEDIDAGNINAWNIDAWNIDAGNIDAGNIDAENIDAEDINAEDILYYAFCCVYKSIKCNSIKAKREKHYKPICLDGDIKYKKDMEEEMVTVKLSKKSLDTLKESGIKIID